MKKVGIIMGSDSDLPVVEKAFSVLDELEIPFEVHVYSAHRTPAEARDFALNARANGFGAIIAAAGKAAHLAGALAAASTLPVIGIPVKSSTLDGLDALLATVQMPTGIPVATVAIDGAANAALLAAQILAVTDADLAAKLLESVGPMDVINGEIIPALNEIGGDFESGKAYLPQLLMSAEAASAAFEKVKEKLPKGEGDGREFIIATVKGDIHDIGKNIVRVMLESYGFTVHDLGRDVAPEAVLDAVKNTGCKLVGLSALMTTTVPAMAETIELLRREVEGVCVVVGGAVLNEEYAEMIKADKYCPDAMAAVRFAEEFYK